MVNFYTDTIRNDPRFGSMSRIADPALLEPVTRELVATIIADAAAHGTKLTIFETFRSQARQAALFDQGATRLKQVGVHHYGLACDLVKDVNGEPSWKGDFSLLGELAHYHRMIWGATGVMPESSTALSTTTTSNAAPSDVRLSYSRELGIRMTPTTHTRTALMLGLTQRRKGAGTRCGMRRSPPPRANRTAI